MRRIALAAAAALLAAPASAHTGAGGTGSFVQGFAHPLGGIDHVLAMVAVGLFASQLGGRALWAVPLAFAGAMLAGGTLAILGVEIPAVETGIALSVVVVGALAALGLSWPLPAAAALVGVFAIFHGQAHGAEMPLSTGAFGYSLGFTLATALLHALGVAVGLSARVRTVRLTGTAVALCGIVLLLS